MNNSVLTKKKWFQVKERPIGKPWNEKKSKNREKNFDPPGRPGGTPRGPHISAWGPNIEKRLDDVICIPTKVTHAKFYPNRPRSFF